ncbi:hypothetical protein [Nocardia ignorata]|uniref:Uncharacterized protein n=1 Tax=Nocardia ignorata TaxID=145285 RepID=A0A4R6P0A4_NOCIG|nr:hypothetical protein [Nocardia ignorata]TDP29815.1 hypothetical protein DFR75_11283 [Nocardia ignorata]
MTAPLPDLFPNPLCESNIHLYGPFAPAPIATLWANVHNCSDVFMCAGCLTALGEGFAKKAPIKCPECAESFAAVDDYLTWREL